MVQDGMVAGIVAEYNPFHKGHEWMVRQLRAGGIRAVVCVMSGPFVQRAEPALLPTAVRARAALAGGADLVLRLPVPWATASAEGFAAGAVGLLSALGCVDVLAFGAETADAEILGAVADVLLSEEFKGQLKAELAGGVPFAVARSTAADRLMPGAAELLKTPNNILGIEYCKALRGSLPAELRRRMPVEVRSRVVEGLYGGSAREEDLFSLPVPLALPRLGAAHDGQPQSGVASASWLRAQVEKDGMAALEAWVPPGCAALYQKAWDAGMVLAPERWELAELARLRGLSAGDFADRPGAGEGLEARLAGAARRAGTLEELYTLAKSKRFAHSRVRRLALAAALGLPQGRPVLPPFAQVLGASPTGLAVLKQCKQKAIIPVSGSLAKLARAGEEAACLARREALAEDLYALCQQRPMPGGQAYTTPIALATGGR